MNTAIFLIINSWVGKSYWLDRFMVFASDRFGYLLIAGVVLFFIKNREKYRDMLLVSLSSAVIARFGFVAIIRFFYFHPRPFMVLHDINVLINNETESSFPSGHASFYFALAMGVYLYNKKAGYAYLALAGLIGFARIFISVHWPLDILAGAFLGIGTALLVSFIKQKMSRGTLSGSSFLPVIK